MSHYKGFHEHSNLTGRLCEKKTERYIGTEIYISIRYSCISIIGNSIFARITLTKNEDTIWLNANLLNMWQDALLDCKLHGSSFCSTGTVHALGYEF
jgi:amino acid permease